MTFDELVDGTLEEIGYAPSTASSEVIARIKRRVNEWHRRLLAQPGHSRFLKDTFSVTFASVSGTATYGLPASVGRINSVYEDTNDVKLEQRSLGWLRTNDAGLSASGTPEAYIPLGISAVRAQPADASALFVKSSSASDTTQTAKLTYLDATGLQQSASVTLTGVTAAALGTGVVEVLSFRLTAVPAGYVTLHEDSGTGTELARIPIGAASSRFLRVQLWPTPTAVITYHVDATRDSVDLVDDFDEPLLPRDFHYLLQLGAVADEFRLRDDSRYEAMRVDMEQGKRDLKSWLWNNADFSPTSRTADAPSRLGGWFPAGS